MNRYLPMLASPWPQPFDDQGWWFEVKWDGFRVLVDGREGRLRLLSRRGNDLTGSFPELTGLALEGDTVLDGEIVVFDPEGRPSFSALQQRLGDARRPATLVVFDLLFHGEPLISQPIEQRWERLRSLDLTGVVIADPVRGEGTALYRAVVERELEGVVAKRAGSRYHPGRRSPDWRKIAHRRTVKAVVGGYLPGERGRAATFGSLLLGLWQEGALRFVGAVGSGFGDRELGAIHDSLERLRCPSSPFVDVSTIPEGAVWVEPSLVAVVEFKEWTHEGRLRGPSFKGFSQEPPEAITWEEEGPG